MTTRLRRRLAPPYGVWDWLPALVLLVLAVADVASSDTVVGSRALLLVGASIACVALLARRRLPLLVLAVVGVAVLVPSAAGAHAQSAPVVLVLVAAVFSVARYERRPWAFAGLPLGMALALVGSASDPRETLASSWTWSLNVIWIFGIGLWLSDSDRRVEATRRQAEADARAAAAEERLRVARDLHDVLAHSLSLMVVQAEVADELLDGDPAGARRAVGHVQEVGRAALRETRSVLGLLRDPSDSAGLAHLPALAAAFRDAGLPVLLDVDTGVDLAPEADATAYRVVQEALTNALRHAGGPQTRVGVLRRDGAVHVRVENDAPRPGAAVGSGGPGSAGPSVAAGGGPSHGLLGMRERVESCGGRLSAGPLAAGGFVVEAVLPGSGGPP